MKPAPASQRSLRVLLMGGIAGAMLHVVSSLLLISLDPDYNVVRQFISELGEAGRDRAQIVCALHTLEGLMFAGFALGLARIWPNSVLAGLGARLLLVWSAAGIVGGLLPCDAGCAGETLQAQIHILVAQVGAICGVPVPLFVWLGRPDRKRVAWFSVLCQTVILATSLLLGASMFFRFPEEHWFNAVGAFQRIYILACCVWIFGTGWELLQLPTLTACNQAAHSDSEWSGTTEMARVPQV